MNQGIINNLVSKIEKKANKVTSWSQTPTDDNYPSEKLVKDSLAVATSKHILEATRTLDGSRVNLTINLSYLTTITDPSVDFSPLYVKLPSNMASTTGGVRFIIKYNNGNSTFPTQQLYDMNGSSGIRENVLSANEIIIIGWDSNKLKLLKILGKEYSTVAETGSYNDLTDKPTIPTASISTPSADTTNGSIGDGTTWARSNHTHPKSSLYAEASHTHSQYLTSHQDITGKEDKSNKITSLNEMLTESDTDYPSSLLVLNHLDTKEDISNKVISMTAISTDDEYPSAKCVYDKIEEKIDDVFKYIPQDLGAMAYEDNVDGYVGATALSNDYEDLDNKPTIPTVPTNISSFNNDSGYLTAHQDITGKEDKSSKVTSLSSSSTDTQYPSAKAVYDAIENTFNLDTLDCINENFTLLSLPQIVLTYNESSFDWEDAELFNNYSEGVYVDWGDETSIETYADNGTFEHDYLDNMQEHTIIIYGDILNDDLYPYSFYNLTGMTSINIPSSVTSLGKSCFRGCAGLTSVTIPNGVTSLGLDCFYGCSNLINVVIPSSVTSLGNACFQNCTGLTSITIPSSVTSLGSSVFNNCSSLTNVTIPSSVTSLGNFCFFGCTGLTSVTIPSSVISLGSSCFRFCTNLVDYQLYWETPPITWSSTLMPNNTDTYFTIPNGTAANYTAKGFPSDKLVERSE